MPEQKIVRKPRGHLPEKTNRNKSMIALYICGFSQWEISKVLRIDRRNLQRFISKYFDKYALVVMNQICDFIIRQGISKKPTKLRRKK